MTDYRKLADTILHLRSWGGLKDVDAMTMDEWKAVDTALRLCADRSAPASSSLALTENDEPLRELCFDYRNAATAHAENYFQRIVRWVKQQEVRSSFAPAASERNQAGDDVRDCCCADPENCTQAVPGYRCRRVTLNGFARSAITQQECEAKLDDGDAEWPCKKCGAWTPDHCSDLGRAKVPPASTTQEPWSAPCGCTDRFMCVGHVLEIRAKNTTRDTPPTTAMPNDDRRVHLACEIANRIGMMIPYEGTKMQKVDHAGWKKLQAVATELVKLLLAEHPSASSAIAKQIPLAKGDNVNGGWTLDFAFLEEICDAAELKKEGWQVMPEAAEAVILALIERGLCKSGQAVDIRQP